MIKCSLNFYFLQISSNTYTRDDTDLIREDLHISDFIYLEEIENINYCVQKELRVRSEEFQSAGVGWGFFEPVLAFSDTKNEVVKQMRSGY